MNLYIQYHNVDCEGLLLSNPPLARIDLGIRTKRQSVLSASGNVLLIAGIGSPRRFFLWETFEIAKVKSGDSGWFVATGLGWQLKPPQELSGRTFEAFRAACANFVGFREITKLPYARQLWKLAKKYRATGAKRDVVPALWRLRDIISDEDDLHRIDDALNFYGVDRSQPRRDMLALSIRQPHAEAILRGVKKTEYRSRSTKFRGRFYIYASRARYSAAAETKMMATYRIKDTACDELPRGSLVGTAELYDCDGGDWHVRKPRRDDALVEPEGHPQPVWFRPFR